MLGYRAWTIGLDKDNLPTLKSIASEYVWETKDVGEPVDYLIHTIEGARYQTPDKMWHYMMFSFDGDGAERIPEMGYWAYNSFGGAVGEVDGFFGMPMVIGLINGTGKIAVHEKGFRSEYSSILGFLPMVPCGEHMDHKGNIYIYGDHLNLSACKKPELSGELNGYIPTVQYAHDKFFKDLSAKYDVDLIDQEIMEKFSG
jgi:hypothetical protein